MDAMTENYSRLIAVMPSEGLQVAHFAAWVEELEAAHGEGLIINSSITGYLTLYTPGKKCSCGTCHAIDAETWARLRPDSFFPSYMILCPDCGNKRCQHAAFHENACTGSNEVSKSDSRVFDSGEYLAFVGP